ncbi:MAG: SU10 major capsid protein [bacterium]
MATTFLGMRGTGDWQTDQRPKNWREGILKLYPNGDAPLTAIMSKMSTRKTDDPEFNWWTQGLPTQAGAVTNIYTDAALSSAYVSGGVAGDVLYVNVASATALHFRAGHQCLLRDASDYTVDVNGKVMAVVQNGASSYLAVKLLEDDDNSATHDLSDCDYVLAIGNINPEGGAMPDAVAYDPVKYYNYTQIFRTPLSITRTARLTRLRTGDAYKKAKMEALEMHSIEMEKAFIWGYPTEGTGDNGKPERTTGGLVYHITANGGVVSDYATQTVVQDAYWVDGGEEWLDYELEQIFRYGSAERLAFAGSGTILQINKLVKENGNYDFTPATKAYGIQVTEWVTPFGVINILRHPLFSYETTNRNSMIIFEPKDLESRVITDTTFYPDPEKQNTGRGRIDGTDEEYLTEIGLEFHHPIKCAYLNGFGETNGTPA